MKRFLPALVAIVILLVCLAVVFAPLLARAHGDAEWIRRGEYYTFDKPRRHCWGISDCHRLERDEVMAFGDRFKSGSLRLNLYAEWPAAKTYVSEDENYWVCFTNERPHCFFAPAGG